MSVVALALAVVTGSCVSAAFIGAPWRRPFEGLGLSLLFGLGGAPAGLLLTGVFAGVPAAVTAAVFAALLACIALALRPRGRPKTATLPKPAVLLAISMLLVGTTALASVASAGTSLGWDGLFVWEIKARAICLSNGFLPLQFFSDSSVAFTHPNYPLLQPLADAWGYVWSGDCDERLAKLAPIAFLLALSALIAGATLNVTDSPEAAVFAAALPLAVPFLFLDDGSASSGYADLCLGAYYLASVIFLGEWLRSGARSTRLLLCAACLAGLLIWSKQEGTVYWCFLLLPLAALGVARKDIKPVLVWATPGVGIWTAWHVFVDVHGTTPGYDFMAVTVGNLAPNVGRIPNLLTLLVGELQTWSRWGLLWAAMLIVCVVPARHGFMSRAALIWFVAGPIVVWTLLYTLSAWVPYTEHVHASLPRLLIEIVPTGLFLAAVRVHGIWQMASTEHRERGGARSWTTRLFST